MIDGLKDRHRAAIIAAIAANPRVERAVLFGSRATGTYTADSDVDIALFGDGLTLTDQARLGAIIDDIPMAQSVDLILYRFIDNSALLDHIRAHGVVWHRRRGSEKTDRLHLLPRYRRALEALLRKHLPDVEVWAYGSRVNGRSHDDSDLDLVLRSPGLVKIDLSQLAELNEAVQESTVPFLIEARDWARLPESFQREIEREHVVLVGEAEKGALDGWGDMSFADAVLVNPTVRLERGKAYPFVDMAAVTAGSRCAYEAERREYSGGGSRFQNGDTLMARITPCLENGKIARYCTSDSSEAAHGSTEFIVIRGRPGVTDTEFAYYLTQWEEVRSYAVSQMTGTSGRQRVPAGSLGHLAIAVPPLPEQRAIAHILGTLDDKIELNRRMNETLEAMARALFKSWFVDFDPVRAKAALRPAKRTSSPPKVSDGTDKADWTAERARAYLDRMDPEIAALFPDRFVDSELGKIPAGWEVKPLDSVASFQNGLALQKFRPSQNEARLPVVKITQLRTGEANSGEWASATIKPGCIIENGDVVFSWSGSLLVKTWCGGRAALNQHLFKVTSERYPKWFYLHSILLHFPEFQRIAKDKATTMGHIRRHHLANALCVVPPDRVVARISDMLGGLLEQQVVNELTSRTLITLRDALLPKLVSGELRVKDAENTRETYFDGKRKE